MNLRRFKTGDHQGLGRHFLSTQDNASPVPAPFPGKVAQGSKSGKINLGVLITICVIAFVASKIFFGVLLYWRWSRSRKICEVRVTGGKMVMFKSSGNVTPSTKAVLKKTQNLNNKDIIGSGGYGTVYRLVIDDHTAFAVKKLERGSIDRDRGFERELETLSDIKHRNLVSLRGYYSAPHINLLVYDLMPNGSLETILHEQKHDQEILDWPTRYNIALGAARGIAYLHHDCVPNIIHRDIKSSNILLDENMEAHVSDFGLAKLVNPNQTHVTTIVAGTFGYLAPEYVDTGKATKKGDIFSFGVVLLELITGKRPTDEAFVEKGINLVLWVKLLAETGQVRDAFDENLVDSCCEEELKEALDIACQCLDSDPRQRPTMAEVVKMLERMEIDINDDLEPLSA